MEPFGPILNLFDAVADVRVFFLVFFFFFTPSQEDGCIKVIDHEDSATWLIDVCTGSPTYLFIVMLSF